MASTRKLDPKDPNSKWVCEYTDTNGKRRRYTPKTGLKKDADAFKRKVEGELERGDHIANADTVTFKAASMLWLDDCEKRRARSQSPSVSTIKGYDCVLRKHILPRFGHVLMTKLTGEDVQVWLDEMATRRKPLTVKHLHTIINLVIKFSIKRKTLKRNTLVDDQVTLPGFSERIAIPSKVQLVTMLKSLNERARKEQVLFFLQRRAFVTLALFGGMRVGEICALKWDNLDLNADVIQITESFSHINGLKGPKTKAGVRTVPMSVLIRDALQALRNYYGERTSGFVFVTKNGTNMRSSYDSTIWRPIMKKAGLFTPPDADIRKGRPAFHLHALRHASVSLLIEDGVNSLHIARFVGHANVATTMGIYGHLFPEDTRVKTSMDVVTKAFPMDWKPPSAAAR